MALAIFDLDDTLISGDCASLWNAHIGTLGWVDGAAFNARNDALMDAYAKGELAMEDYMAFSLEPMIGRTTASVHARVEAFIDQVIEPRFYADARRTVAQHRNDGDRIVVVSASGQHLVQPIAARLGIEDVLSIDLESADGRYTGHTTGVLTYREGKVIRLQQWLQSESDTLAGSYFYSDSRNDLPLLSMVTYPNTVNPDPVLRAHAQQAGWPVLRWR